MFFFQQVYLAIDFRFHKEIDNHLLVLFHKVCKLFFIRCLNSHNHLRCSINITRKFYFRLCIDILNIIENSDLGIALKGANEDVQNAIFNNLSKRLAAMIKEDMEFMGPVRMKDVEEAQQKIVSVIRKLEDAGEIVISRGGGDEIIV